MTATALLSMLDGVVGRGNGKWTARCPAHPDRKPSLSVSDGERGVLVHCWAGCSLGAITSAMNLTIKDLFYDAPDSHTATAAWRRRVILKKQHARQQEVVGYVVDALREAEAFLRSRRGLDISGWTDAQLDADLNCVADAYALLDAEERGYGNDD
jgi:hypothetical protein